MRIHFPQDEAAHENKIEWWYFNGHLKDKSNNPYSFMTTFFKLNILKALKEKKFRKKTPQIFKNLPTKYTYIYSIHSQILDIKNQKFYSNFIDYPPFPWVYTKKHHLYCHYGKSIIKESSIFNYKLKHLTKDLSINLKLKSNKQPVLQGQKQGIISLANIGSSYYYSLTNLQANGFIKLNQKKIKVQGISWMDHQWGNWKLSDDKWNWLSIQLKDNTELTIFHFPKTRNKFATITDKNSEIKITKNLTLKPLKYWKSPKTKIKYPVSWLIKIPKEKLNLEIIPNYKAQEMLTNFKYWEGSCSVEGTKDKKPISGQAFMELAGYDWKK